MEDATLRNKIRKGLSAIKIQLGLTNPNESATVQNYTLDDGTVIQVQGNLQENSAVQVVTSQGISPIPDGVYSVHDDEGHQKQITTSAGIIVKAVTQNQQAKDNDVNNEAFASVMNRIECLENENKHYKQSFNQVLELVELLVKQPTQPATELPLNAGLSLRKHRNNPLEIIKLLKENK